jgi:cytochrome c-type biogenesis protein CcsB
MKRYFLTMLVALGAALPAFGAADPFAREFADTSWKKAAGQLAIQAGGRVKPLDTFAREGVELLTGGQKFKLKEGQKKDSMEILLSLAFEPQVWQEIPFIEVPDNVLRKDLGLAADRKHFSPGELMKSARLMSLFQEMDAKLKAQEKLNPYFQGVQRMANQMGFLQELISGRALRLVPPTPEQFSTSDAWLGFDKFSDEQKLRFALMAAGFTSDKAEIQGKLGEYISKFQEVAVANNPKLYPPSRDMSLETHFNSLHPFRWAWILSLTAALLLAIGFYGKGKFWYWGGMAAFVGSFLFQIYGFALRCYISGHPPVTNMYESVIWVAFGCMLFGFILESVYRKRIIALGALVFGTIALVIADNVSGAVDDSIHPLEPVLRNNMWLTIHVLTITLGYAAFALSMILGNMGVGQWVVFGKESKELPNRQLAFFAYRAVQVGVILLAAGTILGGVWADYSWGRFWGWDPKETWALIALLGYLALIHARFRGMVGPFGFLVGCVAAFLGVVMAWYGVNFVLGAGLHSYGFGSGGVTYVATYCAIQLLFLGAAALQRSSVRKNASASV